MLPRPLPSTSPEPSPADDDVAVAVLRQLRQVFNAVKSHFQQVEKTVGIGGAQVWALSVVRDHPGIGVGDLARAMSIHQSTASNLARALIERHMIVATKQAADRRAVQLSLLPAGARILRDAPGPFAGLLPDALRALPEETLERLNVDLALLIEVIAAEDAGAAMPLSPL